MIVTGAAGGTATDIGIVVGVVALLEVAFILVWGRIQYSLSHVDALALGTAVYVVYLALLGLSDRPWHVYALTLASGLGAAALISIPITYLQDLIADRPGLGSSLIAVNIFLGGAFSAALFAVGTRFSDYSGTALLGAAAGLAGLVLLLLLDGKRARIAAS